jgi:hypothetical protein
MKNDLETTTTQEVQKSYRVVAQRGVRRRRYA